MTGAELNTVWAIQSRFYSPQLPPAHPPVFVTLLHIKSHHFTQQLIAGRGFTLMNTYVQRLVTPAHLELNNAPIIYSQVLRRTVSSKSVCVFVCTCLFVWFSAHGVKGESGCFELVLYSEEGYICELRFLPCLYSLMIPIRPCPSSRRTFIQTSADSFWPKELFVISHIFAILISQMAKETPGSVGGKRKLWFKKTSKLEIRKCYVKHCRVIGHIKHMYLWIKPTVSSCFRILLLKVFSKLYLNVQRCCWQVRCIKQSSDVC